MRPRIRIDASTIFEIAERAIFIRSRANQDIDIEFNGYILEITEESTREDGRPAGTGSTQVRPAGVRAAVGAGKRGNARRAKGGRKANGGRP